MSHHKDKSVFCPRLLVMALLSLLVCALIVVWLLIVVMLLGSVLVLGVGVHFIKIITQRLFLSKSFSISILRLISSSTK
jgi:fatty acid desaturase